MNDASVTGTRSRVRSDAALPPVGMRWRCAGCGNLTRFDVVRSLRTREYWHVDLSGEGAVEEATTLVETVESVTCRWCGRSDLIELVERPDAGSP